MSNKWTPGPWKVDGNEIWSTNTQRINLVTVATPRVAVVDDHLAESFSVGATARMIAAAPELYEALNTLLAAEIAVGDEPDSNLAWSKMHIARDRANAALAKARGET